MSTGVKTFTLSALTWSAGNASDRILVIIKLNNTIGSTQNIDIDIGTTNSEIISPVSEVVGDPSAFISSRILYKSGVDDVSVRILYKTHAGDPGIVKIYPYDQTRDHNLQGLKNEGSWATFDGEPCFSMTYSVASNIGFNYWKFKGTVIDDSKCIRYKFRVNTAFHSDLLFINISRSNVTAANNLIYTFYDSAGTNVISGEFISTTDSMSRLLTGGNAVWHNTSLGYSFSEEMYTLTLAATVGGGVGDETYNPQVIINENTTISFQGSTGLFSFSGDGGVSWGGDSARFDLCFMLSARAVTGTVLGVGDIPYWDATVNAKSTTSDWGTKTTLTDHSGYYEFPLERHNYTEIKAQRYDFKFHTAYSINAFDSGNFNTAFFLSTVGYNNSFKEHVAATAYGFPFDSEGDCYWWDTEIDGTPTSPGMNYAFRDKILFGVSHTSLATSIPINFKMKTGNIRSGPKLDAKTGWAIQTVTFSTERWENQTHFLYLDNEMYIRAVSYDHSLEQWFNTAQYVTSSRGVYGDRIIDAHMGPSIAMDSLGRIHCLFGAHNNYLWYIYSSPEGDITQWSIPYALNWSPDTEKNKYAFKTTYPSPHFDTADNLYVFARYLHVGNKDSFWIFYKKHTSGYEFGDWATTRAIFRYLEGDSGLPGKEIKSVYNIGNMVDQDGNLHCAVSPVMGYNVGTRGVGVFYMFSTSGGDRWQDLKKRVSWNATAGHVDIFRVPGPFSYSTIEAVIWSSATSQSGANLTGYGGNFDSMDVSLDWAVENKLRRPFFLMGQGGSSDPIWQDQRFILSKWSGGSWDTSFISDQIGYNYFSGPQFGGGLVFGGGNELWTYYGAATSSARIWGGGPALIECRSVDYGSSWSGKILMGGNEWGQIQVSMKRNYSYKQIEVCGFLGPDIYYFNDPKIFPYMRGDGEDVRVVYRGSEIDRVGDVFGVSTTNILFKLQEPIALNVSSATSGYYYVYYGRTF